jgi:hypothetical protein
VVTAELPALTDGDPVPADVSLLEALEAPEAPEAPEVPEAPEELVAAVAGDATTDA